jgi:putative ABC transport system permease protein
VTPTELETRIDAAVSTSGSGLESITGDDDTAEQQADLKDDLSFFNSFLMAFAYVALFVGTFIIYNTFSIVVAQRTKEMAMLRAIGARRGQVLRSVVLESVVVGVLAAAIGLVAGVGLSFGLRALLGTAGLDIPSGSLVLATGTVVTAFAVGVTVSVISAIAPAVRASKVRPIAALRDVAVDRSGVSLKRAVAGLLLIGAGVALFAAGVVATDKSALSLIGSGAALVVVGMVTSGPVLVRPVLRVFGAPIAAAGITGRYARENAHRNPKRTAATASALMIGVALVGFITILASSTTSSVESAVDKSFRADYVVDSGSWDQGFATSIEDDLRGVDGVETLSPLRNAPVEVILAGDSSTTTLQGMDTTVLDRLYDLEVTAGSLDDVRADGVALAGESAEDRGLALGDTATFRFAGGDKVDLTVRALYDGEIPGGGDSSWLVGLDTFQAHVTDQFDRKVFLTFDDGVSATDSRTALDDALRHWPNAEIQDQAEFKAAVTAEIQQILNLIYGLLALAVVIALIGIANTLALSIHERTPELGLLRSIGMQRRQLKRAVRWEALMIAVIGAVMGAVLAIGGAYGIVTALDSEGVTELTIPVSQLTMILGLAGFAGVVAASGPARRAARLDPLEAISQ